jgi:hypothetical protein
VWHKELGVPQITLMDICYSVRSIEEKQKESVISTLGGTSGIANERIIPYAEKYHHVS